MRIHISINFAFSRPYRAVEALISSGEPNFCYAIESLWEKPDEEPEIYPNTFCKCFFYYSFLISIMDRLRYIRDKTDSIIFSRSSNTSLICDFRKKSLELREDILHAIVRQIS